METSINLIWINRPSSPEGHALRPHSHMCHQLCYTLEGEQSIFVDNQTFMVCPGCLFLIPPLFQHSSGPAQKPMRSYELKFTINDPFLSSHLMYPPAPLYDSAELFKPMFAYIFDNWLSNDAQTTQNIDRLLHSILFRFFVDSPKPAAPSSHFIDDSSCSPVTQKIFHYIEHSFSEPFSLDKLSESLNYNKSYLCTVFRKDTGYSIVDYLSFARVRFAIISFLFYGESFHSVRESSGLPVPGNFSRTFKHLVGIPPQKFRAAVSSLSHDQISLLFASEPIVNYRICSVEDAFRSLQSIGNIAATISQQLAMKP